MRITSDIHSRPRHGRTALITLRWTQFGAIVAMLGSLTLVLAGGLFHRESSEALFRLAVRDYQRDFGFEVGPVRGWRADDDLAWWGLSDVQPGGRMHRAGFRTGDAIFDRHGGSFAALHGALNESTAGRSRCVEATNVADYRAGRFITREVCLPGGAATP